MINFLVFAIGLGLATASSFAQKTHEKDSKKVDEAPADKWIKITKVFSDSNFENIPISFIGKDNPAERSDEVYMAHSVINAQWQLKPGMSFQIPKDADSEVFFKDGNFIYLTKDSPKPSLPYCKVNLIREIQCKTRTAECLTYDPVSKTWSGKEVWISKKVQRISFPENSSSNEPVVPNRRFDRPSTERMGTWRHDVGLHNLGNINLLTSNRISDERFYELLKDDEQPMLATAVFQVNVDSEGGESKTFVNVDCHAKIKKSDLLKKEGTPSVADLKNVFFASGFATDFKLVMDLHGMKK